MTNRTFDNATEFAISTTGETLTSNNTFRNRWSDNTVESFRQIGIFGGRFTEPSDTPPVDTSLIWIDTSGTTPTGDEPAVIRYFNSGTMTWDPVTFDQVFPGAATGTDIAAVETAFGVNLTSSTGSGDTIALANASDAGVMSPADKQKLDGITAGAEANVQADFNEADPGSDAFILNKPTVPNVQTYQDEGVGVGSDPSTINFAGAGVTASESSGTVTVTIPGGSPLSFPILDEGVTLTTEPASMDFVGAGVTATQIANAVTVTIPGGGSPLEVLEEGGSLTADASSMNFVGAGITASNVGTDVTISLDSELNALAGLTSAADQLPYFTGSGTATLTSFTGFGRSLVDDADATTARGTLGLGTIATQAANSVAITGGSITGITDLAVADGGTGGSTSAAARQGLEVDSVVSSDGANATVLQSDRAGTLRATASITYSFEAAATLGSDWYVWIIADGGDVTLDPNGAETVDGQPSIIIPNGSSARVVSDGSNLITTFTAAVGSGASVLIIEDQKASGTDGGTATAGSYNTRDLNTEVINELSASGIVFELAYDAQTANFTVGDILTGGTSGATAAIIEDSDGGATGTLKIAKITGTLQDNETITDPSGGSATSNIPGGVVNNNEFTVSVAGEVSWSAPAIVVNSHKTRLYNVTDAVVVKIGSGTFAGGTSNTHSFGTARVEAGKVYRIEHRVQVTRASDGFGAATSFGDTEVYTRVEFRR